MQQDRVKAQFVGEVTRVIAKHLNTLNQSYGDASLSSDTLSSQDSSSQELSSQDVACFLSTHASQGDEELPLPAAAIDVEEIIIRYHDAVREMLDRQSLEVSASISMDTLASLAGLGGPDFHLKPVVQYRHEDAWGKARSFTRTVRLLVDSVLKQYKPMKSKDEVDDF